MLVRKKIVSYLIVIFVLSSFFIQIGWLNINNSPTNQEKIHLAATQSYTKQWITNPNFTSSANWTSDKGIFGDPSDVSASISDEEAKYDVLGKKRLFNLSDAPPSGADWIDVPNPNFPQGPSSNFTDSEGLKVYHLFDDRDANQNPSVHWDRNFTLPVNMSDYTITSASIQAVVNATVSKDVDVPGDINATEGGAPLNQQESYDYVRFYVLISDLSKNNVYEIAYNQTTNLGAGEPFPAPAGIHIMGDTYLITVSEQVLIFYLTNILQEDFFNFTVTLGIRIFTADNSNNYDNDEFHELLIKSVNLNFTYEKKVDQLTSISWDQDGDKPNDLSVNPIVIDDATLNFKYKINDTWSDSSPNSEIRFYINNYKHTESVKLSTATGSFQYAKNGGFDVTSLIDVDSNVNLSIEVYIADEFTLNRSITISIDEINLTISYTETFADTPTNLDLFLDMSNKTLDPFIELPYGEFLNITIKYTVNQTGAHISNATVELAGKVSGTLSENITLEQYTIMVNTSQLGIGVKILSITAQKDIYEPESIQFFVEVVERDTEIQLFIDGNQKSDSDTIQLEIVESINVTVNFRDIITQQHLSNATINLIGRGQLNETNNQYNITLNAQDLRQGITVLTIFAQLVNYQSQSIQFYVNVIERATEIQLFIEGDPKNDGDTIQLEYGGSLNVTANFLDNFTKAHLPNATVELVGRGSLNETNNQYNVTVTSQDLGLGTSALTILAQLTNYQSQSVQFFVEVYEKATEIQLFVEGDPKNDGDTIQLEYGGSLNVTINFRDNITKNHLPSATVDLVGRGSLNETNNQYNITVNSQDLGLGTTVLTIFAQLNNYQSQSIQIFVDVYEKATEIQLFIDRDPKNDGDTIQLEYGGSLNVTVNFRDNITKIHLPSATVELVGRGALNETNNQYNITVTSQDLGLGTSALTIFGQLTNYSSQYIQFFVEVYERATEIQLFVEGDLKNDGDTIKLEYGGSLNVTVNYRDNITKSHLPSATVELVGMNLLNETNNQYNITVNAVDLGQGTSVLTIFAQLANYQSQSIQIFVEVSERATELQLFVEGNPTNNGDTIQLEFGGVINVTVNFRDNTTKTHLPIATVELVGRNLLNETNNQYNITVSAVDLGLGISVLTIFAQLANYQSQSIQIFVEVIERATELQLFIEGNPTNDGDTIQLEFGGVINVTVNFRDNITYVFLSNANVELVGRGLLNETNNRYNITITSQSLGLGTSVLTIFAQLTNYQSQSIQFFVEVYERATELQLFVEGNPTNDGDTVQLEINEIINVTVNFRDNSTKIHLPNAIVDLVGRGLLNETNNQYSITVSAVDLGQGITMLTIFAQLANYQPQSIQFFVEVIERATELQLFVEGNPKNDGDTIQLEIDDSINVTISFKDNLTKALLSNATVNLIGKSQLNETNNQYNITINAMDLDQGITVLTIFAQLENYQAQSIQFFIEVVERSTNLQLFLNNEDKTSDPVIISTISTTLNITVRYTDNQTGLPISNATLQLIGESLTLNLTEDIALGQHYIIFNTSTLDIGVKLFTIVAQSTNYQIQTINPRITIERITGDILQEDGTSQISIVLGEVVILKIKLNDTFSSTLIKGALVTYKWAYGQGELEDLDNDGLYEGVLSDIVAGTFIITVRALAGDNFKFEDFKITFIINEPVVSPSADLSWLVFVLIGAIVGLVSIFVLYQSYFKYPPLVRKIRKLRKNIGKGKKTIKPIEISKREKIIESELKAQTNLLEVESIPVDDKSKDLKKIKS